MLSRNARTLVSRRTLARAYSEGAPDGFNQREKALEDLYVRQKEKEQLAQLQKILEEQLQKIKDLETKVDGLKK